MSRPVGASAPGTIGRYRSLVGEAAVVEVCVGKQVLHGPVFLAVLPFRLVAALGPTGPEVAEDPCHVRYSGEHHPPVGDRVGEHERPTSSSRPPASISACSATSPSPATVGRSCSP